MKNSIRLISVGLAVFLLACGLMGCSEKSEVPDGYQYATCNGEYFRLFVPTQWAVRTDNGVSGATIGNGTVTMEQIDFVSAGGEAVLDDFRNAHLKDVSALANYASEKDLKTTLCGHAAYDMTYKATVGGVDYRFRQLLTKVSGRFYLFTYSARSDVFDAYLDAVDGMLENLEFYSTPYNGAETRETKADAEAPEGMTLVSNDEVAFRFYAPTHWTSDLNNGNCLVYVSDADRSNVSVLPYTPESDGVSVGDYWKVTAEQYESTLTDFALCGEPEASTLGGRDAMVYTYTYSMGGVTYKVRQVIAVYSAAIYNLTYTATEERYDLHAEDVLAMQEAFEFRAWGR